MRRLIVLLLAGLAVGGGTPLASQVRDSSSVPVPFASDTSQVPKPFFTTRDAYFIGGVAVGTVVLAPLDVAIARTLRSTGPQNSRFLRDAATGFRLLGNPGAVAVSTGMYLVGLATRDHDVMDVGLHTTEAFFLGQLATQVGKDFAGRARPLVNVRKSLQFDLGRGFDSDDYRSFPSGHTSAAFATAAALSTEITRVHPEWKWYVRPPLYGGAALVGLSRIYDNKHWASDVLVGAAVGAYSAWKVVEYNHANPNNRLNRWLLGVTPAPTGDGGVVLLFSARLP
jgi:membrane-associated phospholipid phosphatase